MAFNTLVDFLNYFALLFKKQSKIQLKTNATFISNILPNPPAKKSLKEVTSERELFNSHDQVLISYSSLT